MARRRRAKLPKRAAVRAKARSRNLRATRCRLMTFASMPRGAAATTATWATTAARSAAAPRGDTHCPLYRRSFDGYDTDQQAAGVLQTRSGQSAKVLPRRATARAARFAG